MWIRKSAADIADVERRKRRSKFNPIGPFLVTLTLLLIDVAVRHNTAGALPVASPVFAISFVIIFGLLYMGRVMLGRYQLFAPSRFSLPHKPNMICVQCHTVQSGTKSGVCNCGGKIELLDHWRWIADDKPSSSSAEASNKSLQPTAGRRDNQLDL
jgi:hypothetical protein